MEEEPHVEVLLHHCRYASGGASSALQVSGGASSPLQVCVMMVRRCFFTTAGMRHPSCALPLLLETAAFALPPHASASYMLVCACFLLATAAFALPPHASACYMLVRVCCSGQCHCAGSDEDVQRQRLWSVWLWYVET